MGIKVLILFTMIFMHIIDDYYLQVQGWLGTTKQKSWWKENAPDDLYKHDYIVALFMHSFSWSFMIMLPATVYIFLHGGKWYPVLYLINLAIHMIVDNAKANQHKISLVQDQSMHMLQIILTWLIVLF